MTPYSEVQHLGKGMLRPRLNVDGVFLEYKQIVT